MLKQTAIFSSTIAFLLGATITISFFLFLKTETKQEISSSESEGLADIEKKSLKELSEILSSLMMPDEEYEKLLSAIYQTAVGLLRSSSQVDAHAITTAVEEKLKADIKKQYGRNYFTTLNAKSMSELGKSDLIGILSFYQTIAGQKFLKLSPIIIETTMKTIQSDLTNWLPGKVEAIVSELSKSGTNKKSPG